MVGLMSLPKQSTDSVGVTLAGELRDVLCELRLEAARRLLDVGGKLVVAGCVCQAVAHRMRRD